MNRMGRRFGRKGDVFFVQDFVAWLILILVAVLIFGLFWVAANFFKDKISAQENVQEAFAASRGGAVLRVYAETRMDEPVGPYLRAEQREANFSQEIAPMEFGDAASVVFNDSACVSALKKYGTTYTTADGLRAALEPGLCRTFLIRTILFYHSLVGDSYVLQLRQGGTVVRIGHGFAEHTKDDDDYERLEESVFRQEFGASRFKATPDMFKEEGTVLYIGSQPVAGTIPVIMTLLAAQPGGLP